jgi:hypothetical protein
MPTYRNTPEQEAIIAAIRDGRNVGVQACAGAGKTSTLVAAARGVTEKSILYLAYNKALALEAQAKMPSHVTTRTVHALGYRACVRRQGGVWRPDEIGATTGLQVATALNIRSLMLRDRLVNSSTLGYMVLAAIRAFCYSADRDLGSQHFRAGRYGDVLDSDELAETKRTVIPYARDLLATWWPAPRADATRTGNSTLKIPHDLYLKFYVQSLVDGQMAAPVADIVMIDEFQDSNAVTLQLVEHLIGLDRQIVAVGDPYQQIYEWRGSEDAFSRLKVESRLRLTQSFRFGPETSALASAWLRAQFGVNEDLVLSTQGPTPIRHSLRQEDATMVICRTNQSVAQVALGIMQRGRLVCIPKGSEVAAEIADIAALKEGRKPRPNGEYAAFASFDELLEHVESDDGRRIKVLLDMIDIHGEDKLIGLLKAAGENYRRAQDAREAALAAGREPPVFHGTLVCTGHASKGLESDRVGLSDDFNGPAKREEAQVTPKSDTTVAPEAARLLYVAMTRARQENNPLCVDAVREVYKAMDPRHADTPTPDGDTVNMGHRPRKAAGQKKSPVSRKPRPSRKEKVVATAEASSRSPKPLTL